MIHIYILYITELSLFIFNVMNGFNRWSSCDAALGHISVFRFQSCFWSPSNVSTNSSVAIFRANILDVVVGQ